MRNKALMFPKCKTINPKGYDKCSFSRCPLSLHASIIPFGRDKNAELISGTPPPKLTLLPSVIDFYHHWIIIYYILF